MLLAIVCKPEMTS